MLGLWRQARWNIWDGWASCPNLPYQLLQKIIVLKYCFLGKHYLGETLLLPICALQFFSSFDLELLVPTNFTIVPPDLRRPSRGTNKVQLRVARETGTQGAQPYLLQYRRHGSGKSPPCRHGGSWHCAAWSYCCYCCVRESHFQFIIGKSWPVSSTAT